MKILPHEKLGITFDTLLAFLGIHAALKNGVMRNARGAKHTRGAHLFDMSCVKSSHSCGSVGCIGGYAYPLVKASLGFDRHGNPFDRNDFMGRPNLHPLFFPMQDDPKNTIKDWADIPVTSTIKTLEHFLATGKVEWKKFVPKRLIVKRTYR